MSCRLRHRLLQFLGYLVFIRYEETGLTALYINRLLTRRVVDCRDDDSRELLLRLFDPSERPEIFYQYSWTPGEFVAWDNRCTNHARPDFGGGERRLLRRTTVQGIKPEPAILTGSA